MKEEQLDLFGLVLDKVKDYKGYTVISLMRDADPGATLYRFDTKEEFDKVFTLRGCYPESIDEDEIYNSDYGCFYLVIDGKLIR
jgi:hypothetical protein